MVLDAIFGHVSNEHRATSTEVRDDHGKKLHTFEYKCEVKGKRRITVYTITGAVETDHAKKRVEKIYDALKKTINEDKHGKPKPIDLQRAMEKALHSAKDLKKHDIKVEKAKVKK